MVVIRKRRRAFIEQSDCVACGCCVKVCPLGAIQIIKGIMAQIDMEKCVSCGYCVEYCPRDVLRMDEDNHPYMAYRDDCWYCDVCKFVCKAEAIELKTVPYLIR